MEYTYHAEQRIAALERVVGHPAIHNLRNMIRHAPENGEHAVVVPVHSGTDPDRRQWQPSNRIAALLRNGRVVTVYLTRTDQCTLSHFRVESIIS